MKGKTKKGKKVDYSKWGYIFILPFFAAFFIFSFIPLLDTVRYSFYEFYRSGLKEIGPNFIGLENYKTLLTTDLPKYIANTFILWIIGFVPQIIISLLLASWFANSRMKIKGKQAFKVIIYLPNLIMASAFSMLFFALFSDRGPINSFLVDSNIVKEPIRFFATITGTRGLIGLMNFLMWFGNTTIMLMAAIMGINASLFEAAEIDGCTGRQIFFKITLPMIKPILAYTLITSMIGGLQMFDVPQILTNGQGSPDRTSTTLIMYLNNHLASKNFGMAGALSVFLFVISGILCFIVYKSMNADDPYGMKADAKKAKKLAKKGAKVS